MMKTMMKTEPPPADAKEKAEKIMDLTCGEEEYDNGNIPGRAQKTFFR